MDVVFKVKDKTGRKIRLTKKQWNHITRKHPYMTNYVNEIKETIEKADNIVPHEIGNLFDYYKHYKHRKEKLKLLKIIVKYLNGEGFIISSYFVTHIN